MVVLPITVALGGQVKDSSPCPEIGDWSILVNTMLRSLHEQEVLEKVCLPSGDCSRLKAPFQIAFSPLVVEWFRTTVPPGKEVGGFLGGEISRIPSGEVKVTITSVHPVRNKSKHPDWEYMPDMRSWIPALRRLLASTPVKLPISFHTHPMEESGLIEAALRHDVNPTVSAADMQSSLEIVEAGEARLQIPQLLIARRPDPIKGVFAAIYGSEIAGAELEEHYTRIVSPNRYEHFRPLVSLASDAWSSKQGKPVAATLAIGAVLGLILAPELALGLLVSGATSILLAGQWVSFDSIDNKGNADYVGFTSHEGQAAVLAFHVPRYSANELLSRT